MTRATERSGAARPPWLLGALALGVAGFAGYSVLVKDEAEPSACSLEESPARIAWNDEIRETVGGRLRDVPTRSEPTQVLARLDAYAESLAWVATDRCWAAKATGRTFDTRSAEALCLLGAAQRLAAVAKLLAEVDGEVVAGAEQMVDALPRVDRCLDQRHLRSIRPLPPSPGRVGLALLASERLAELEMQLASGARAQARDALDRVAASVEEADHLPLRVEFVLLRARLLSAEERASAEELERVMRAAAAAEEIGADQAAARLLTLQLLTLRQAGNPSAPVLAPIVEAKIERSGDPLSAAWLDGSATP